MKNQNKTAYLFHILRSVIFGSTFLFTGNLVRTTAVSDVLALRFLISAVAFLILAAVGTIHVSYKGKDMRLLVATSMLEPILYFTFETKGLSGANTSLAGILCAMSPVVTVILETVILKERTTALQKLLLSISMGGVIVATFSAVNNTGENTVWGIACLAVAYLSGSLFTVCSRKVSAQFSAVEITFFSTMVGAVVFNGFSLIHHLGNGTLTAYFHPLANIENIVGFLFLGVLSSIVATIMNNYALARIQASNLSALGGISTVVSIVLGIIVNHEQWCLNQLLGTAMILTGAIGVNYLTLKKAPLKNKKAKSYL